VLVGALACPHPPLLLAGVSGAADVAAELRTACRDGMAELAATQPDVVVLVGGAARTGPWAAGTPRGAGRFAPGRFGAGRFGAGRIGAGPVASEHPPGPGAALSSGTVPSPGPPVLPVSLAVGAELLDTAGWSGLRELWGVAADAPVEECLALGGELARADRRLGLVVLGDGSARRGPKAPGYFDQRAAGYDEQARRGLAGDVDALRSLDPELGERLLVAGRAPWQVLAGAAGTAPSIKARIRYAEDPLGVLYLVASWTVPRS
jgi:hypothetical protein